jgi:hypothetical protein
MGFKAHRNAARELAKDRRVAQHSLAVAEEAARDINGRAPARVKAPRGARIYARQAGSGAEVVVKSPVWHWWEFGTRFIPPQPYIRPSVQRALTRAGGKFKAQ